MDTVNRPGLYFDGTISSEDVFLLNTINMCKMFHIYIYIYVISLNSVHKHCLIQHEKTMNKFVLRYIVCVLFIYEWLLLEFYKEKNNIYVFTSIHYNRIWCKRDWLGLYTPDYCERLEKINFKNNLYEIRKLHVTTIYYINHMLSTPWRTCRGAIIVIYYKTYNKICNTRS